MDCTSSSAAPVSSSFLWRQHSCCSALCRVLMEEDALRYTSIPVLNMQSSLAISRAVQKVFLATTLTHLCCFPEKLEPYGILSQKSIFLVHKQCDSASCSCFCCFFFLIALQHTCRESSGKGETLEHLLPTCSVPDGIQQKVSHTGTGPRVDV